MPTDLDEIDQWIKEKNRLVIFSEPLASEGDLWTYWIHPSRKIGVSEFYEIYLKGFSSENHNDFLRLQEAADKVRDSWGEMVVAQDKSVQLHERYNYLSDAIKVAIRTNGTLTIS